MLTIPRHVALCDGKAGVHRIEEITAKEIAIMHGDERLAVIHRCPSRRNEARGQPETPAEDHGHEEQRATEAHRPVA